MKQSILVLGVNKITSIFTEYKTEVIYPNQSGILISVLTSMTTRYINIKHSSRQIPHGLFFVCDISKACDRAWHNGFIFIFRQYGASEDII